MKTLNEVVDLVDMTRRVIQEYEKAGLAKTPTTTNKYGHLQYDESAIERLWQIRFYRELGYNKEQIRKALSDPSYNKHDAIVEQISRLEEKKRQLESMIEIARAYNEMDVLPSDIWVGKGNLLENLPYKTVTPFMAKAGNLLMKLIKQEQEQDQDLPEEFWEDILVDWPTEAVARKWVEAVEKIGGYYIANIDYKAASVQEQILVMHSMDATVFPNSLVKCWLRTYSMVSIEYEEDIKESLGEEGFQYVTNAIEFYDQEQMNRLGNIDDFARTPFWKTVESLQDYALKHFTTGSDEVQTEVGKLHQMISHIGIFSEETQIRALTAFSYLLGSPEAKNALDNGREKGICWFISRAIQIYCKHQQEAMTKEGESNE